MELAGALSGIRVVEIGESISAALAARMLADLGAEVTKVERPAGDPARRSAPLQAGADGQSVSGLFSYLNVNKLGVTLDCEAGDDRELLHRAMARCQVAVLSSTRLDLADVLTRHPGLILASITPFGLEGPFRDLPASQLTLQAAAGIVAVTPKLAHETDREPLRIPGRAGELMAGLHAATAIIGAVIGGASGICLDLAEIEALVPVLAPAFTEYHHDPSLRLSVRDPAIGWFIAPCADGHVMLLTGMAFNPEPWDRLMHAMEWPEWSRDERFATPEARDRNAQQIPPMVRPWLRERTRAQLLARFEETRGTSTVLSDVLEASESAQAKHREFVVDLEAEPGVRFSMPGLPWEPNASARHARRPPPRLGEHNDLFRAANA